MRGILTCFYYTSLRRNPTSVHIPKPGFQMARLSGMRLAFIHALCYLEPCPRNESVSFLDEIRLHSLSVWFWCSFSASSENLSVCLPFFQVILTVLSLCFCTTIGFLLNVHTWHVIYFLQWLCTWIFVQVWYIFHEYDHTKWHYDIPFCWCFRLCRDCSRCWVQTEATFLKKMLRRIFMRGSHVAILWGATDFWIYG